MKKQHLYLIIIVILAVIVSLVGVLVLLNTNNSTTETGTAQSSSSTVSSVSESGVVLSDDLGENVEDHQEDSDYMWESSSEVTITLSGSSASVSSAAVEVSSGLVKITAAGNYRISGDFDGQIQVDTEDKDTVRLILDGVNVSGTDSSAINVINAEKTIVILADGSSNYLSDTANYVFATADEDEPNATLFSKDNLSIYGTGSLTIEANYNDAISSKDGLVINGGNITIDSVDDGIRGKEYLVVYSGTITIDAESDALKSDDEEGEGTGYIYLASGDLDLTAGGDAVQAAKDIIIDDANLDITSGGGSNSSLTSSDSGKGLKAGVEVVINGGDIEISSADDAIHSNYDLTVNSGNIEIASGDDGMHADNELTINNGTINITKSYEGIEALVITINDGDIDIVASDDGLNVAGGVDGSATNEMGGRGGRGGFETVLDGGYLYINGGNIYMSTQGDGLDSNGSMEMTGGTVYVDGPTNSGNGAIDVNGTFNISGGYLVAVGSSGMAESPGTSSTQYSILVNLSNTQSAGTVVSLVNSSGQEVLSYTPSKTFQSVVFSSSELQSGQTYTLKLNGTTYTILTLSSTVTTSGSGGMGGGMR